MITVDPGDTPCTEPALLTVAIAVALLVQVPPVIEGAKAILEPTQTPEGPVKDGTGLTLIVL